MSDNAHQFEHRFESTSSVLYNEPQKAIEVPWLIFPIFLTAFALGYLLC